MSKQEAGETKPEYAVGVEIGGKKHQEHGAPRTSIWEKIPRRSLVAALVLSGMCALFFGVFMVGTIFGGEANCPAAALPVHDQYVSAVLSGDGVIISAYQSIHVVELDLEVKGVPAVAAVRLSTQEALQYHIVAFDARTRSFAHLVHANGTSYRFFSTDGSYWSWSNTTGCTAESSAAMAHTASGLPVGLTVSQLSQQLFGGHAGISVEEVTPLPSGDESFFEGCVVADIANGVAELPPFQSNDSVASEGPVHALYGLAGPGRRQLAVDFNTIDTDLESIAWPVVHGSGYCGSYKAFAGSSGGLWSCFGEGEAKAHCAADSDCTGVVHYKPFGCDGGGWYFACTGGWDGASFYSWSSVRTLGKPAAPAVDDVPWDNHRPLIAAPGRGLTLSNSAAEASARVPATTYYSPGAEPTVGWLGPYLCVMITYDGNTPYNDEAALRNEFFGRTGVATMVEEASWGQYKLRESDVDFITLDTGDIDPFYWRLGDTEAFVLGQPTYQDQIRKRPYTRVLGFEPTQPGCLNARGGWCFRATGWIWGDFSRYRASARSPLSQAWMTIAHELGHNNGLTHAGACQQHSGAKEYFEYTGYGVMSWASDRMYDFNVVNRIKLGWMGASSIVTYDAATGAVRDVNGASMLGTAYVSALNLGPATGRHLVLKVPCPTCTSARGSRAYSNGEVYVSFRGDDAAGSKYGADDGVWWPRTFERGQCTGTRLNSMKNGVHVHYLRRASDFPTELWMALGEGETYEVHGAALAIHVCQVSKESGATVTVGASAAEARARCTKVATLGVLPGRSVYANCHGTYREHPTDKVLDRPVWDCISGACSNRFIFRTHWGGWAITDSQWRAAILRVNNGRAGAFTWSDDSAYEWYHASWASRAGGKPTRTAVLLGGGGGSDTYANCQGTYEESADIVNGKRVWDCVAGECAGSRFMFRTGLYRGAEWDGTWGCTGSQWREWIVREGHGRHGAFINSEASQRTDEWYEANWGSSRASNAYLALK